MSSDRQLASNENQSSGHESSESQQSFSSSVVHELEARREPTKAQQQSQPSGQKTNNNNNDLNSSSSNNNININSTAGPSLAEQERVCCICRAVTPLVAHHVIPMEEAESQIHVSKALGLFHAFGFDVSSASNGILTCEHCRECFRKRRRFLTLPTPLLQLFDDRASSLLALAEDPLRSKTRANSRISFSLSGELKGLAGSDAALRYLLGYYEVLRQVDDDLPVPRETANRGYLTSSGFSSQPPERPSWPQGLEYLLVPGQSSKEQNGVAAQASSSDTIVLWRLRGVSPAAILSELYACSKTGMLTAETLDGEEQYNNANVATNLFAKLERLLEAARGKDNGPQPLKESLLNLVPEIRLDRLSLLPSSSSATETEAPPIQEIPDSHVRPPPTVVESDMHGGRDTTTQQNIDRYQNSKANRGSLAPVGGDPSDDASTKVSPDTTQQKPIQ